ncbi:MAG: hypothetical protein HY724_03580 [Candidatus Rokubacteria bacterium]|nr:hypothetical protein [Candidatus Rokubacteria bacterium]
MSNTESWKSVGLQILYVDTEECGDGSCGCGCGEIPLSTANAPEKGVEPEECCTPVCGPETCG